MTKSLTRKNVIAESTDSEQFTNEESKVKAGTDNNMQLYYVSKIRMSSDNRLVRKIFLRTQEERTAFILAILKAQGFNSQLEQYEEL